MQLTQQQWQTLQDFLRQEVGEESYRSWIEPLAFHDHNNSHVNFKAPTIFMKDWVEGHYSDAIRRTIQQIVTTPFELNFYVDEPAAVKAAPAPAPTPAPTTQKQPATEPAQDSFGDLFAHAGIGVAEETQQETPAEQPVKIIQDPQPEEVKSTPVAQPQEVKATANNAANLSGSYVGTPLDPRFTFDNYVTGKSNEFAYAAARRMAEGDEVALKSYNPFFLYGGVGLGKTHLMHAIAWQIMENFPTRKVMYISAEKFLNNFISALKNKNVDRFQETFRNVDVLMIDDVQFIAGKDATQEEFFHTFNTLINENKQIILTADKSPHELSSIEDRLRSRLGWGLATEIHRPSMETRLAILEQKSQQLGIDLSQTVKMFLADRIDSNIRELEGALNRLAAHQTLVQTEITVDSAQDLLRDLFRRYDRMVTIDEIQKKVSEYYSIKVSDMSSSRRMRTVARPRQIAMYLAKQLTKKSFPEIGKAFGGRDHTTVMHAAKTIEKLLKDDPSMEEDVNLLENMLSNK